MRVIRRCGPPGAESPRPQVCAVPYASIDVMERIAGADVDGDGVDELYELRDSRTGRVLYRHAFAADGSITRSDVVPSPFGRDPIAYDVPDVDHDGAADLVVIGGMGTAARVSVRTDDGVECDLPTFTGVSDSMADERVTAAGDFDGDGLLDLAGFTTCAGCPGAVYLHLGRP